MMKYSDAIEVRNYKTTRGAHYVWRHIFIAFWCLLLKEVEFYNGVDAHLVKDLEVKTK